MKEVMNDSSFEKVVRQLHLAVKISAQLPKDYEEITEDHFYLLDGVAYKITDQTRNE